MLNDKEILEDLSNLEQISDGAISIRALENKPAEVIDQEPQTGQDLNFIQAARKFKHD